MVGVLETGPSAGLGASCAAARIPANPYKTMATAIKHTFRIALCLQLFKETFTQYLRFQRMNPMKRTIATMANPAYTCHPRSIVAETIAPKAESASNRAALPFVSRFCSTTRASLLAAAVPTLYRAGISS
jgi:hypothetical protein